MNEPTHPDHLITLATFPSEIDATLLAGELKNLGIAAEASGILTAGFRAEAPGSVKVLVHPEDLAAAQQIMNDYNAAHDNIDWDNIDVGDMEPDAPA